MSSLYKVMCGCECFIYSKSIHLLLLSWCNRYLKNRKDQNQNAQSRRSWENENHIYETYKNMVMPHGRHIYAKASDMENSKCVRIQIQIMHYHNGNLSCNVVPNDQSLIFLTKKRMINILTLVLQFVFTFII